MCLQGFKNNLQMFFMLLLIFRIDENIINEDDENLSTNGQKILFIISMNAAGAFVSLKGMTKNSKCLYRVLKAVLDMSSFLIRS